MACVQIGNIDGYSLSSCRLSLTDDGVPLIQFHLGSLKYYLDPSNNIVLYDGIGSSITLSDSKFTTDLGMTTAELDAAVAACASGAGGGVSNELKEEVYRLDADQSATATSADYSNPAATPTVGDTVTITGPVHAISARWMRGTLQDPGDGTVARLKIGPWTYDAGFGTVYGESFWSLSAGAGQVLQGPFVFTASGTDAYVEIVVLRAV